MTLTTQLQSDTLTDSIGMNVKPGDFGRSYDTYWTTVVVPQLQAAGIRHVRIGAEPPSGDWCSGQQPVSAYIDRVGYYRIVIY
jgi:hypothetical protein